MSSFDDASLGPLFDQVSDGVVVAVPGTWRIVYANRALCDWIGKAADELRGTELETLFMPDWGVEALKITGLVRRDAEAEPGMSALLQSTNGGSIAVDVRFCRISVEDQALVAIVVRREERSVHDDATTAMRRDPLTALPDRDFLMQRLAALLRGDRAGDRQFAVLFVDLDNFKQINDAHGHLVGDRVLREVSRRLAGSIRERDCVARFGGDEFVIVVEQVAGASEIEPIICRIQRALEKPIVLPDAEFALSLSVGVAIASPDHQSPDDLLRDADRAMYAAKRQRNGSAASPAAK